MNTRRHFFLAAATAAQATRVMGANDRVGVGFIGYGLIGSQHVFDFKNQRDVDMVAMAEAYQPRREEGIQACGGSARGYSDFRKMLEAKDVEAVVVSTPDHWHALMTMMACAAGKDVYVEKPMTLFHAEGLWMTRAARKWNRIVQVGTQQRSGKHYQKARQLLRDGIIGKVHSARAQATRNVMPGFGSPPAGAVPSNFDYDMWLGPAPARSYSPHRGIYHFRWFWDYSGGQMTNLAAHSLDIVYFCLEPKGPKKVVSYGGRLALEDDGETADTQDALYDFGGWTAAWHHREASRGTPRRYSLEFFGTKGSLGIDRGGFEVLSDLKINPEDAIPRFKGHPGGGPQQSAAKPEPWTTAMTEKGSSDEQFDLHVRNFLDCIKARQKPIADVADGHAVSTACHLANISLRLGRQLNWDAEKETIVGDAEAARMLVRPYRKPWDKVLESLKVT